MSKLAKALLSATTFGPIFLVYGLVSFSDGRPCLGIAFFGLCAVLVLSCGTLLWLAKRRLSSRRYETKTVETADHEVLSFLLIYLLPIVTKGLASFDWVVWTFIGIFYCFTVTASYGFHFNPLLTFLRYHFYRVTEENGIPHVLITRRRIYKVGETIEVARLGDYLLIEKR